MKEIKIGKKSYYIMTQKELDDAQKAVQLGSCLVNSAECTLRRGDVDAALMNAHLEKIDEALDKEWQILISYSKHKLRA